jgi:hypothetical protein
MTAASGHHLAQLNIGAPRFPVEDPRMYGFVSKLDAINALAEASPGFVWRLVGDGTNDATGVRDPRLGNQIVNLSVWESRDALWDYVYRSGHLDVLRQRAEWFELPTRAHLVLWWVAAGHIPDLSEAVDRLELLREKGPTPSAFTLRHFFPAEDHSPESVR